NAGSRARSKTEIRTTGGTLDAQSLRGFDSRVGDGSRALFRSARSDGWAIGGGKASGRNPVTGLVWSLGGQHARPSVGHLFLQSGYSSDASLAEAAIPFRAALLCAPRCRRFHRLRGSGYR